MAGRRAPAIIGSALGIAVFQLVGTFGATSNQPDRRGVDVLAVLLVLAGPAALGMRDRWPVAAAAVSVAAADVYLARGYAYGPIFLSVVVALFAAVVVGRRRGTWTVAAAGYAGFLVADALDPRARGRSDLLHLALVAGWLAVVLAAAEVVRAHREQVLARNRAEAEARQRRQGEQRLQLAQELHDVLAHTISQINVQASVALHLLDTQPERARPALSAIKASSHEALQELRGALDLLRHGDEAAPRAPAPQLADLPALVEGVRAGGLAVELDVAPCEPPAELPPAVQLAAYRIVQEALTNVVRHAAASAVTVRVRWDGGVDLEVLDDGRGGAAKPGNGLSGMAERAASVGGALEAGPRAGGGFRVAAHLPGSGDA
jgi:signal transduction histidine kinase